MKKIKVVILIIALILSSLNVAYACTILPLNNAVNDVKVAFTIYYSDCDTEFCRMV